MCFTHASPFHCVDRLLLIIRHVYNHVYHQFPLALNSYSTSPALYSELPRPTSFWRSKPPKRTPKRSASRVSAWPKCALRWPRATRIRWCSWKKAACPKKTRGSIVYLGNDVTIEYVSKRHPRRVSPPQTVVVVVAVVAVVAVVVVVGVGVGVGVGAGVVGVGVGVGVGEEG